MRKRVNRRLLRMGIVSGVPGLARETRSTAETRPRPTSVTQCWLAAYRDTEARVLVTTTTYDREGRRVGPVRTETRCVPRPAGFRYGSGDRIQGGSDPAEQVWQYSYESAGSRPVTVGQDEAP